MSLRLSRNEGSVTQVARHLSACDAAYHSPLSTRVRIEEYAAKLVARAERFEAWSGGALVGLVAVYVDRTAGGRIFISNASVLPERSRRGIASRLIRASIRHARRLGVEEMSLSVSESAGYVIGLYETLGFRVTGRASSAELKMSLALSLREGSRSPSPIEGAEPSRTPPC